MPPAGRPQMLACCAGGAPARAQRSALASNATRLQRMLRRGERGVIMHASEIGQRPQA